MKKPHKEKEHQLDKIIHTIQSLPIDAKVEIILADLDEDLFEKSMIIPIGLFHRNYHKDIDVIQESEFENHLLQLKINRDGLYDALPEGLFHQPSKPKKGERDKEEILQEIREQKAREKAARKIFLPIEQELYRARIAIELEEVKYFVNANNSNNVFRDFWGLPHHSEENPSFLNHHQISNIIYLLPLAHRIVGDFALTELCFESILQDRFAIKNTFPISHEVPKFFNEETLQEEDLGFALGRGALGVDFILNSNSYRETIPAILINIGPIEVNEVSQYAKSSVKEGKNGKKRDVLEYLINNFLPYDADTIINIEVKEREDFFFAMAEDFETSEIVLGINSRL